VRDTLTKHLDTGPEESDDLDTFLSLISKIDVLKTDLTHAELDDSDEYAEPTTGERTRTSATRTGRQVRRTGRHVSRCQTCIPITRTVAHGPAASRRAVIELGSESMTLIVIIPNQTKWFGCVGAR
jgi:hypothetical protein